MTMRKHVLVAVWGAILTILSWSEVSEASPGLNPVAAPKSGWDTNGTFRPTAVVPLQRVHSVSVWSQQDLLLAQNHSLSRFLEVLPLQTRLYSRKAIVEPLLNLANVQYLGTVQVGTPGQDVRVIFDTGSSDFWIDGSALLPPLSRTLKCPTADKCDETVTIQYSVGSVSGQLRTDRLSIGAWSVASQVFVLVTSATGFGNVFFQGVLGLAFPPLSHGGGTTVLSQLTGQADGGVFAFLLANENETSNFIIGLPPEASFQKDTLTYVPVAVQEWWTLKGALAIGHTILCEDSLFALDTGTSYLTLPVSYFKEFLKQLLPPDDLQQCGRQELTNQYVCPCESRHSANIVYLLAGGQEFPIFPEDLFSRVGLSNVCVLEVQPSADAMPFILGDTFLRSIAAIFDAGRLRIGMAQRVGHVARLAATREHLHADRSSPRSGPLMPPHTISSPSPPYGAIVAAIAAGLCLGYAVGSLVVRCCEGKAEEVGRAEEAYQRLEGPPTAFGSSTVDPSS